MPVTPFHLSVDIGDVNSRDWESRDPFVSHLASNVAIMSMGDIAILTVACACRIQWISRIRQPPALRAY